MTAITAQAVKSLRDRTSAGMMDCKRALQEAAGDEERAIDLLRQWGAAKAAKRAGREMSEGTVFIEVAEAAAAMVAVTSETDFVARNEEFQEFGQRLAARALRSDLSSGRVLGGAELFGRREFADLEREFSDLRSKIGENLEVRQAVRFETDTEGTLGSYLHFGARIGVIVELGGVENGAETTPLARDLAMHIAATNPKGVTPEDIPDEERDRERSVLEEQTKLEGKPEHIVERIVDGRMRKYFEQNALVMQGFVRDPDTTIRELLQGYGPEVRVRRFVRFEIGG